MTWECLECGTSGYRGSGHLTNEQLLDLHKKKFHETRCPDCKFLAHPDQTCEEVEDVASLVEHWEAGE